MQKIADDLLAAAYAIAGLIGETELREDYIIPSAFDKRVAKAVADAVGGCI
jgi:malate dehydrogenase (oxaloacetate-decarboxylating)